MTTLVQKLLARPCFTVSSSSTVGEVVNEFSKHNIGDVPVVNNQQKLEGIISERDIVRRLAQSEKISELCAADLMTRNVISVSTSATSSDLMKIMTEKKCRHLPIVSEGKLAGMVSIGDVVKRLFDKYETEAEQMRSFINS